MKRKKAALYDPYLDVLGGGERYVLSILEVLEKEGYEITIFWDHDISDQIHARLQIDITPTFEKNIFKGRTTITNQEILRGYDLLLYVTDGSYFFSSAKKNFVYCMVPQKNLYRLGLFNKIKLLNFSYICHSKFTQYWLKRWGLEAQVLYPYISDDFMSENPRSHRERIILSVGRFFPHLHSKRHDIAIKWFTELQSENRHFHDYKLILAGSLKDEDKTYFHSLSSLAKDNRSIHLMPNISYSELLQLYKRAAYYWHMSGFGVDENKHPELVEHLGITPLEAMASGCIVFAYQAGGPRELIQSHHNGFLFSDQEELFSMIDTIQENQDMQNEIRDNALEYITNNFSYEVFREHVLRIFT